MANDVVYELERDPYRDERIVVEERGVRDVLVWEFKNGPKSAPEEVWPVLRAVYAQPDEDVLRVARVLRPLCVSRLCTDDDPCDSCCDLAVRALTAIRDGGAA